MGALELGVIALEAWLLYFGLSYFDERGHEDVTIFDFVGKALDVFDAGAWWVFKPLSWLTSVILTPWVAFLLTSEWPLPAHLLVTGLTVVNTMMLLYLGGQVARSLGKKHRGW